MSKLWSPLGSPKYEVPYYTKDLKKDHDFDDRPHRMASAGVPSFPGLGVSGRSSSNFLACTVPLLKVVTAPLFAAA